MIKLKRPAVPTNATLGARVKARRRALALRPEAVTAACGLSNTTLAYLESGRGLRSEYLPTLAAVLGVSLDFLFGLTDDPTPVGDQAGAAATVPG